MHHSSSFSVTRIALTLALLLLNSLVSVHAAPDGNPEADVGKLIAALEKKCRDESVPMVGPKKAARLAQLVREAKPRRVVECGSAIGYSGLWIARELAAAGRGELITIEIDPKRAREAEEWFRRAGYGDIVTVKVGDVRTIAKSIEGPVDFVFIDCGFGNYYDSWLALRDQLFDGAVVVADNAGIGATSMADYLKEMRTKYESRTEWFDIDLPWAKKDALEITVVPRSDAPPPGFTALFNGRDFTGWTVPEGDGGHWKIVDGVIDYDAQSEARGDKSLWCDKELGDFVVRVDWRIKETPYVNPRIPYILPDGTHARDIQGSVMRMALPDSDSGIFLRDAGKAQVNIWCWPIGSGEMYGYRTDGRQSAAVRASVTPRTQADRPVGQWNRIQIPVRGSQVSV